MAMLVLFEQLLHPISSSALATLYGAKALMATFIELAILIPIILCKKLDNRSTEVAITYGEGCYFPPCNVPFVWLLVAHSNHVRSVATTADQLRITLFAFVAVQGVILELIG